MSSFVALEIIDNKCPTTRLEIAIMLFKNYTIEEKNRLQNSFSMTLHNRSQLLVRKSGHQQQKRLTSENLNAPSVPYPITDNCGLNKDQLATRGKLSAVFCEETQQRISTEDPDNRLKEKQEGSILRKAWRQFVFVEGDKMTQKQEMLSFPYPADLMKGQV